MKKIYLSIVILAAFCFMVPAQVEDQMSPSEIKQMTAVTEPATLYKGLFRVGLNYNQTTLKRVIDAEGNKIFVEGNGLVLNRKLELAFQYGLTKRIQLNLYLPYALDFTQQSVIYEDPVGGTKEVFTFDQKGYGLGDIGFGVYGQIIRENETLPSLTAKLDYYHPTGRKDPANVQDAFNYDQPTGRGEPVLSTALQIRKVIYPYSLVFYANYFHKFGGEKIFEPGGEPEAFKTGYVLNLQGGINFHFNDWLSMANELVYNRLGESERSGQSQDNAGFEIAYQPYFHFQIKQFRLVQAMQVTLTGKNTTMSPYYFLILQYTF